MHAETHPIVSAYTLLHVHGSAQLHGAVDILEAPIHGQVMSFLQSQTPLDRAQPGSRRQDGVDYDPLAVDPHKLKPDAELKRIFGARTIREAQREEPSGREHSISPCMS